MKTGGKIILIICVLVLFLFLSATGVIVYYYTHPSALKALVEHAVSRSTGTTLTIKGLTYATDPIRIAAKGIVIKPPEGPHGFSLDVPDFSADLSLEGPFGGRSLMVERLRMAHFSCRISEDASIPGVEQKQGSPSFFNGIIKRLIAFFFFRDVQFQGAELSEGSIIATLGERTVRVKGIQARLNAEHLMALSCAVHIDWPGKKVKFKVPYLDLETDGSISLVHSTIGCLLSFRGATFGGPGMNIRQVRGEGKLHYQHGQGDLFIEHLHVVLGEVDFGAEPQGKTNTFGVNFETEGAIHTRNMKLVARPIRLHVDDMLRLEGTLDMALGGKRRVKGDITSGHVKLRKLLPFLPEAMRKKLAPLRLSGSMDLAGRLEGLEEEETWGWDCDLRARCNTNQVSYTTSGFNFRGTVTGDIRATGRFPGLRVSGLMTADRAMLSGIGIDLEPFRGSLSFSGQHPSYEVQDVSVRLPRARGEVGKKTFMLEDITLKMAQGRFNGADQTLSMPDIHFNAASLKDISFSLKFDQDKRSATIKGNQADLINSASAFHLLPSGWTFSGRDAFQIGIVYQKEGVGSFASQFAFEDVSFQNLDGSCAGENLSLRAKIDGTVDPSKLTFAARGSVTVDRGEVLYDRFYLDLKEYPFSCGCRGRYDSTDRHMQVSHLGLGLGEAVTLQMEGRVFERRGDWAFDLSSTIPETPLSPLFSLFVIEPFWVEKPGLKGLRVEGSVDANLKLRGAVADWMAKGSVRWHNGGLFPSENDISLQGIDLSLPVWFQNSRAGNPTERLKGALAIQKARLPFLPEQALAFPIHAGPNQLSVDSPTILKVPGGKIRVGPLLIGRLFPFSPAFKTSLTIEPVKISSLLAGVWTRPLKGTVRGHLDPVHFEKGALKGVGEIVADAFQGEIILSDPHTFHLFSGTPVIGLNARWKDLNLSDLTSDTSFGKIEGVLKGYAKGVELSNGQPQKFDLLMETVRKRGVPQRISVKAVDNIAQLGGGKSPFIGAAGLFASFFKEFTYEKIGVHATLENDVFRMNGIIKEGGIEYFVKRGLFSGVNVINQNPENVVSFKDMVKRIKRIRTSKDGPIVE